MKTWMVPPLWKDGECFIIGGGKSIPYQFDVPEQVIKAVCRKAQPPSVYSPYMSCLHDKHVIGINNAYQIGNWIDAVFFGDGSWYALHRRKLLAWPGLRVSCAPRFVSKPEDGVKFLQKDRFHIEGIASEPTKVAWNKNSGASAISLAHHLGVKRIYLLGFDIKDIDKKNSHWHGAHKENISPKGREKSHSKHLRGFPAIARDAEEMGIEIINLSPQSRIKDFPKSTVKEVLQ